MNENSTQIRWDKEADQKGPAHQKVLQECTLYKKPEQVHQVFLVIVICVVVISARY
jgi:hypothetical protein